jgi:FlaA1/EpsC-like NDP-sugar epimerase
MGKKSIVFSLVALIGLSFCSFYSALLLRFDGALDTLHVLPFCVLLCIRHAAYMRWSLHERRWRFASTGDLVLLVKAHLVTSVGLAAVLLLFRYGSFPRSVLAIEFCLSLLMAAGGRVGARLVWEAVADKREPRNSSSRGVIVLGAGVSGHLVVKMFLSQRRIGYTPVAVLDDSEHLQGSLVHGIRVVGKLKELDTLLEKTPHVSAVVVAIPSISQEKLSLIEAVCQRFEVPLKCIQSFDDIACIDAADQGDGLTPDKLLRRDLVIEHEAEIGRALQGKRVLVTGAGGSIGSELVRQILAFKPASLVMVDSAEYNLFKIEREINRGSSIGLCKGVLATITDQVRLARIFAAEKPEYVFHAAAYKHVPLLEVNPYEAFVNNVVGTRNVLAASVASGVSKFVMISTDKAVDPSSIMGCSKRISEFLVQCFDSRVSGFGGAVVRFGNVINSAGSVIPLFREQILSGGPVTVTHPDMERFFMSIKEAVRLVLTAGTLGDRGEIYILDMGKPIKIVDVARKMLALYGRRDIPIVFTGIRPGEKLKEELTDQGEAMVPSAFRKVFRSRHAFCPEIEVESWIHQMERTVAKLSPEEISTEIRSFTLRALSIVEERALESNSMEAQVA